MEITRRLDIGDRVRVKTVPELHAIMDSGRYFPELNGRLYLADEMEAYAGMECFVYGKTTDRPREAYKLELADTGKKLVDWVWCPSMLDDPEEDDITDTPEESPVSFLLGL